jgi:hypothetical protein
MVTINDVITRMDEIVAECRYKESRIGYFAVLYRHVTIRIKEGILNGEFEDNPRMEKLDILFANRFLDAYEKYSKGQVPSSSWGYAFAAANSSRYLILQHLFLGINAHINLDLGIAAVETMKGKNLIDIHQDFNKINSVLSELVEGVKENIRKISPVFSLLIRFAKGRDDLLLNFSIQLARDGAWKFANEYHATDDHQHCIELRDQVILGLAESLCNPGKRLDWIISLIRLAEWKSVSVVMNQLGYITGNE